MKYLISNRKKINIIGVKLEENMYLIMYYSYVCNTSQISVYQITLVCLEVPAGGLSSQELQIIQKRSIQKRQKANVGDYILFIFGFNCLSEVKCI